MPFHLFSSGPFMFWYTAQLLLLLHFCLGRDGNLEESIRTQRVVSYPSQKDFSPYERKNVVEIFHNAMKKVFPSFLNNETDYSSQETEDSRLIGLSLKSEQSNEFEGTKGRKRREIEIPISFDGVEEDGNVQFEPDRYSLIGDPTETSSDTLLESLLDNILTERPTTLLRRVIKKSLPKDPYRNRRSTEPSKTSISKRNSKKKKTKDKSRGITVWQLEEDISAKKETRDPTEKSPSNNHARKRICSSEQPGGSNKHSIKRKCLTERDDESTDKDENDDLSMEMNLERDFGNENGITENIVSTTEDADVDQQELILSLLPLLPDEDIEVDSTLSREETQQPNGTSGAPHFLILCIFGALCLLGIALLIMGIYTIAIKYVNRRDAGSKDPVSKQDMSRIQLAEGMKPKKTVSNPKDVHFLLHTFLKVLEKNPTPPNESLNQKYRSHAHFKAMKRITRKTKIFIKQSL